ncbi:peritrophic matrix protein 2-A precursor [Tribolium castaneum]|uniref:Peritrophic matrix protein 2-A n=1 Tax=Tribolium castaneum TaxID=7070 RepID=D1MAJ1_TRICA|nr:peritrophic matrix protein 2-A precursor [Tribolium castaneum]ACY95482.1 peritrophic matrix protein 2-A [Tribolium castaneum]EFA00423.1 hypothetical protein TcasGA2_TC003274 [Tribolium castaneum]|eukprot:NP_001161930.1 peritrophic matrix protein 2-A precursor [Tribolium castaneum]
MKGVVVFTILALALGVRAGDPLCSGLPLDQEVLFPSPIDCSLYYKCYQGIFSEEKCPKGLYFSEYNKGCVEAQYSECMGGTGTPPSPTTSTTTTEPPTETPDPVDPRCIDNETSYWPHVSVCHLYIECYGGKSYEMTCPPGTYFSDQHKKCVEASQSECCISDPSQCK